MDESNFRFLVLNRELASSHKSQYDRKYAVISVTDPRSKQVEFVEDVNRISVLHLQFSDTGPNRHPIIKKHNERSHVLVLFSDRHARDIFDFFSKHREEAGYFLVHCEAGLCRSPAVAAALCLLESGNDEYFFRKFLPNRHVYRTILNYLDKSGHLEKNWYDEIK